MLVYIQDVKIVANSQQPTGYNVCCS